MRFVCIVRGFLRVHLLIVLRFRFGEIFLEIFLFLVGPVHQISSLFVHHLNPLFGMAEIDPFNPFEMHFAVNFVGDIKLVEFPVEHLLKNHDFGLQFYVCKSKYISMKKFITSLSKINFPQLINIAYIKGRRVIIFPSSGVPVLLLLLLLSFPSLSQKIKKIYYPEGPLKAEGLVENGSKSGCWQFYYPDGKLSSIECYRDGQLHGKVKYYNPKGYLIAVETWEEGLQQDSAFYYHPNGTLSKKGIYAGGLYEGKWVFFHENGKLKRSGFYRNGLPEGKWKFYNEQGTLIQEGHFKDGLENGEWKFYSDDGKLQYFGHYTHGKKTGKWFKVTKKGKIKPLK